MDNELKIKMYSFTMDCKVMFDPAGHPFCLCQMKQIFASADFALL